jgi:hypothetical protein
MGHHFLHGERWWFCVSANYYKKGDDSIGKCRIQNLINIVGMVLGVAFSATSFFILRKKCNDLQVLKKRVEDLEYDRLCEAYKQAGYEIEYQ